MKTGTGFFLLILFFSTSFNFRPTLKRPPLSDRQNEVLDYFKEVALGFEYGNASGITRKWKEPMKVYVSGETTPALTAELETIISELNGLFTDGFSIELTDKEASSNLQMYFGSRENFSKLHPVDASTVAKSSGLFHIFWNSRNQITRGYIFIHTYKTTFAEQRHTIREELTQALGLGKDSPRYNDSIFQSSWTTPTQFSEIDRELIRLLYHPDMPAGVDGTEIEDIAGNILLAQNL